MDWKQVAVNTLTALGVAVLSGVLVWWFTRTPESREGLVYSVSRAGGFGSGPERLTVFAVDFRNEGSAKATSVSISIKSGAKAALDRVETTYTAPAPTGLRFRKTSDGFSGTIPAFLPNDQARVSLLYKGSIENPPNVYIRSSDGIGREKKFDDDTKNTSWYRRIVLFLIFLLPAIFAFFARSIARKIVNRTEIGFLLPSKNDSAFLLLHCMEFDLAERILIRAVESGSTGPIVLSNLAVAKTYNGNTKSSENLLRLSIQWAITLHSKSVVHLNSFLHFYKTGDLNKSYSYLKLAFKGKATREYCNKSILIQSIAKEDSIVMDIISKS